MYAQKRKLDKLCKKNVENITWNSDSYKKDIKISSTIWLELLEAHYISFTITIGTS